MHQATEAERCAAKVDAIAQLFVAMPLAERRELALSQAAGWSETIRAYLVLKMNTDAERCREGVQRLIAPWRYQSPPSKRLTYVLKRLGLDDSRAGVSFQFDG